MPTLKYRVSLALVAVCLLASGGRALHAAPTVDVVSVDLAPLIDRAAESPTRFAVDVPHPISTTLQGEWSKSGSLSTWTYSVQIPGAVSMSFHATEAALPANATLIVTADGVDYVYAAKDARGGDLWSRIGRGDSLTLRIDVATEDVGGVRLEIASLQAGYRSLGDGMLSNAHYNDLRKHALATQAPCAENWMCDVNATNAGPGDATVALTIANMALCTGVLLNDVPGDGAPYVLTARHCQTGKPEGGAPGAAASIVVYWNGVKACGSALGSVFDSATATQFGATTVVEQQDDWLVRLSNPPVIDAYYAGWDATGGTFVGGFSPHHADATSRQFVGWYGQAAYFTLSPESLGVTYTSTFWGTNNALGAGGPGSSGAGLFTDSGHLVGTVARGLVAADGTGTCPATPPLVPTQANATAESTALSGVFNSTADPGSTTGTTTLQTVLDPGNTGTLVAEGQKRPIIVTLTTSTTNAETGTQVQLFWSSTSFATSCTASGGETGDGWPGSVANTGNQTVTSFNGGDITYTVSCTDGQRTGKATVTVHWVLGAPTAYMNTSMVPVYGVPFLFSWSSNVRPCTASGGTPGDGWGGAVNPIGVQSMTENIVGPVTYSLTCGSGTRVAKQDFTTSVDPPEVSIAADAVTLRVGEPVTLSTNQRGAPCAKSGGGAGDGWAGAVDPSYSGTTTLTESVVGKYTYTFACGGGAHVATAQTSVTFNNNPPAVSLQASSSTAVVNEGTIQISWDSNIRPCHVTITGPAGYRVSWDVGPHASYTVQEGILGQYVFDVACGSGANTAHASTAMNFTGTATVQLQGPTGAVRGVAFNLSFYANTVPCTTSGGAQGDAWAGQFDAWFQTITVLEPAAGRYTYTVTCGSGTQIATDHLTLDIVADAPQVTLTVDRDTQLTGKPVTLSWSSNTSPCNLFGGGGNDGWNVTLGGSGSRTVTEPTAGMYAFGILCGTGSLTVNTYAYVLFGDVAAPTLTASKTAIMPGETVTLTWASADGSSCFAQDNVTQTDEWYGSLAPSGSRDLRVFPEGDWSFYLTCGTSLRATVHVKVNPQTPPTVAVTASTSAVTLGDPVTLTYTVSNADGCGGSGGTPGDGWTGSLATQGGSATVRPTTVGTYGYTITCFAGSATASASVSVTVSQPAAAASGGGGGGGSMGPIDLAFFSLLGLLGYWHRRQIRRQA